MANVVATEEPDTAANIMHVSTVVMGRPPCTPPTKLLANSTKRPEMPPFSIKLPARIKKGIAASGNLSMALNISLGAMINRLLSNTAKPRTAAPPMDTAIDTLSAKPSNMVIRRVIGIKKSVTSIGEGVVCVHGYWRWWVKIMRHHSQHAKGCTKGDCRISPSNRNLNTGEALKSNTPCQ